MQRLMVSHSRWSFFFFFFHLFPDTQPKLYTQSLESILLSRKAEYSSYEQRTSQHRSPLATHTVLRSSWQFLSKLCGLLALGVLTAHGPSEEHQCPWTCSCIFSS